ncbi:hypothetical protein ACS0YY_37285, partial [Burkholderia gladioli]
ELLHLRLLPPFTFHFRLAMNDDTTVFTISASEYRALQALAKFQLIEFSLKLYLARLHQLSSLSALPADSKQTWSFAELDEQPFGILLKRFANHCSDTELVARLREIKPARDIVAHRAVAYCRPEFKDLFGNEHVPSNDQLTAWAADADKCLEDLTPVLDKVFSIRHVPGNPANPDRPPL